MFSRFSKTSLFIVLTLCFGSTLPARAQTLSVTSTVSALTIHPGDTSLALPVAVSNTGATTTPVTITLSGLPSGITFPALSLAPGTTGNLLLTASVTADAEAFPGNNPNDPDSATTTIQIVATQGAATASTSFALTVSLENPGFTPAASNINLPIVNINTGGTAITSKTVNVPGTITITSADGNTAYLPGLAGTDNTATFHVHGNTTALMPKLPYNISLTTSTDLLNSMGLACGYVKSGGVATCDKSKSYILLANYDDKTMLRDWAGSALANAITFGGDYLNSPAASPTPSGTTSLMWWAPHSLYVELYLNGAYQGTYQLIEQVKVDSHRVNINEMAQTDTSGKALTGGYLLEIDQRQDEDFTFVTPQGVYMGLIDPDFTPEVSAQTTYINNYVNAAEASIFASNYTDPTLGWRAYFDEASLVNYYLVNDITGNDDAGRFFSSVYLYKDKNNPLLYMGPVWDFDLSASSAKGQSITSPFVPWTATQNPWYPRFFSDPGFAADTAKQFNALKTNGVLSSWITSIIQKSKTLEQAQQNNFARWPMIGIQVWPETEALGTYDGDVEYLSTWLRIRIGYLDTVLNNKQTTSLTLTASPANVRSGVPTTLTATVTGSNPTGTVLFSENAVALGTATLTNGVATLTTSALPPGTVFATAYYDGDTTNGGTGNGLVINALPAFVASTATVTPSTTSPINFGDSITLTASVANTGSAAPTGTATFYSNGSAIGTGTLTGTGSASLSLTTLNVGIDSITVVYSGDTIYSGSTSTPISVTVNGIDPQLTFAPIAAHTYGDAPFPISATSSSTGLITYSALSGPATVAGNTVTITGAGPVQLTAAQSAQGNYAATTATANFTIAKATPNLAFATIAAHTYSDAPFPISATSASTGTVTYSVVSGPATIAGSTVTITGSGNVVLEADQAAQGNYDVATVRTTFTVATATPTLAFGTIATHTYGDAPFAVSATSASTGTVTYSVVSGPATIAGSTVTITGSGNVVLEADQAAQGSFATATVRTTITVAKADPTVTFATIAAHTFGDAPFAVSATSASTGAITYSVISGPATISGSTVTLTGAGAVTLKATQAATDNDNAASGTTTLTVARSAIAVTMSASSTSITPGQTVTITATPAQPGITLPATGTVTFIVDGAASLPAITLTNGVAPLSISTLLSGSHTVSATYSGDQNYQPSTSTAVAITVAALDFTLTAGATTSQTVSVGTAATFTAQLAPLYQVYPGAVTLALTGLPSGASYTVTPSTIAASTTGSTTVTVSIQTTALTASRQASRSKTTYLGFLLLALPLAGIRRKRSKALLLATLLVLLGGTAALSGCGDATPKSQTFPLTLNATSGSVQHTVSFTLTVD